MFIADAGDEVIKIIKFAVNFIMKAVDIANKVV